MGGRIIYVPNDPHECGSKPVSAMLKKGTQWQCNDCDQVWVVVEGAQYNEPYSAWRRLTERNRDGRDL
ncbi:hypothetical protein SEA_DEJAVU_18 [Microbacterium Phage DejaVu]|nr:hypothetical protein SEA_ROMAN_17 [Microbacterium phage Roman]QIG58562.1 hypothetical protein SEA_HUBBS_17 [Microbacterium phage Hubbs]WNM66150.1 hypothetical protein SEA_DEJAVU_18 [Microbacterium Phage DejaVu]